MILARASTMTNDMNTKLTLAALVTTVVVTSVNSIVNSDDAITTTTIANVRIALIVTTIMSGTVTINAMIVTVTVIVTMPEIAVEV